MNLISKADMNFIIKNKELSYLNLDWDLIKKLQHANQHPFKKRTVRPDLDLLRIIRDPANFHFTCSAILNKDIHPFQNVCLQELWNRPFPMLLGSRGASKTFMLALLCALRATINQGCKIVITGAAFRQAKVVFEYLEQLWDTAPVWRDLMGGHSRNGSHHDSDRWWFGIGDSVVSALPIGDGCLSPYTLITYGKHFGRILDYCTQEEVSKINQLVWGNGKFRLVNEAYNNGIKPTKIIKTSMGFSFEGSCNHAMKILRNGIIDFVRSDQIQIGDNIIIDRSIRWHQGKTSIHANEAYCAGLLVGDGCWTNNYRIGFASNDIEASEALKIMFEKYGWELRWCGEKDSCHYMVDSIKAREWLINYFGLIGHYADTKQIPLNIMKSTRDIMSSFISGLFDADGHVFVNTAKGGTTVSIGFTNTSKKLVEEIQFILLHYGIVCNVSSRQRKENKNWKRVYELLITGPDAHKFHKEIGFRLKRKQNKLEKGLTDKTRNYGMGDNIPGIREDMSIIAKKYRMKKGTSTLESSQVSGKRIKQLKNINHRIANIFCNVYKPLVKNQSEIDFINKVEQLSNLDIYYDKIISIEDGECETYDIHVPEGNEYCANGFFSHNSKIRGYRANYLISDEFSSQNPDIYENVIAGFAFVSANPIEKIKESAIIETYKKLNIWGAEQENKLKSQYIGNQSIIASTCYYDWNHLYKYYKRYKSIIQSQGDPKKLADIFQGPTPEGFDYKDYSIIRLPLELMPKGLMDEKQVQRSKVTTHSTNYLMEFSACFAHDSDGFFKRTLIESCVCKGDIYKADGVVKFKAIVVGNPANRYVYGIDPAAESDKFSIVVLELHEDHNRIVYCWTTDKADHREKLKAGIVKENSFYAYINDKVRALMKIFPCVHISMDSQGGGGSVMEAFRDKDKIKDGEQPLLLITPDNPLSDKKERECDGEAGLHIVELINFVKYDWTAPANHNMRMDFEQKNLLFPYFDPLELGIASELDLREGRMYDTLEECVLEIEDLKDELATIVMTATSVTGREHWDTPEIKESGTKKGRMRKDRYSALLMANASARVLYKHMPTPYYTPSGGFVGKVAKVSGKLYTGPAWFVNQMGHYGNAISKRGE